MNDEGIRSLALFFFYAFPDPIRSLQAASRAADVYYAKVKKKDFKNSAQALVQSSFEVWNKTHLQMPRGKVTYSPVSGFIVPAGIELKIWHQFQQTAPDEELLMVIWSQILKISDKDIAESLEMSPGTVRYRTARGLVKLGLK